MSRARGPARLGQRHQPEQVGHLGLVGLQASQQLADLDQGSTWDFPIEGHAVTEDRVNRLSYHDYGSTRRAGLPE
jgi:hypothetical protein